MLPNPPCELLLGDAVISEREELLQHLGIGGLAAQDGSSPLWRRAFPPIPAKLSAPASHDVGMTY